MIVSHKHQFIFIKTKKTAGTSVELFLAPFCGPEDVISPLGEDGGDQQPQNHTGLFNPFPEWAYILANHEHIPKPKAAFRQVLKDLKRQRKFYNHIPAYRMRNRLGKAVFDSYYKFCIERNPWDKTISHYFWVSRNNQLSFEAYMDQGAFCHNLFYYSLSGKVVADNVVKYESLRENLAEVMERIGIPFSGDLGTRAKGGIRKDKRRYDEIFKDDYPQFIDVVGRAFEREIALHGYTFPQPEGDTRG